MTTTKTTTELRRCIGSKTFGIEPHEAPIGEFPVQPSRKDGLGMMCKTHWTAYTRALRQAAVARKAAKAEGESLTAPVGALAPESKAARKPRAVDPEVATAEALIAEVDAGTEEADAA
jgi:hypothetical protein